MAVPSVPARAIHVRQASKEKQSQAVKRRCGWDKPVRKCGPVAEEQMTLDLTVMFLCLFASLASSPTATRIKRQHSLSCEPWYPAS
jgi:hypothetical protein